MFCLHLFNYVVGIYNNKNNNDKKRKSDNNVFTHMLTPVDVLSWSSWSDAEQWIEHILVPQLHQNHSLSLVGWPRLRCTPSVAPGVIQGDSLVNKKLVLPDLKVAELASQK